MESEDIQVWIKVQALYSTELNSHVEAESRKSLLIGRGARIQLLIGSTLLANYFHGSFYSIANLFIISINNTNQSG